MSKPVKAAVRAASISLCLWASVALAIAPQSSDPNRQTAPAAPALKVAGPDLYVAPSLIAEAQADRSLAARAQAFRQSAGGTWEVRWDARGDRPNVVQGSGAALIPGRGNTLAPSAFGATTSSDIGLDTVAREARGFIDAHAALLKLDGLDLRLDRERSIVYGKDKAFWSIEFAQYADGVRVDGAFVFVRVAHGNVVQFGAERIGDVRIDAQPRLAVEQAFRVAWQELAFPDGTRISETVEPGELRLYPVAPQGEAPAASFTGTRGQGYDHVLAWRYVFRVEGNPATWEVLFDAHANRVISLRDLNDYVDATVSGGVYETTNTDPEIVIPFPFAAVSNDGAKVTDTLGIYDYSGGTATTALNGKYFRMSDNCGSISLSNSTGGNLNFGSGSGTDCATPSGNTAGPGNTHASRSGFYHLSRINEKARGILPGNSWLQTKVQANMNINSVCNAFWDGGALNFFKSGSGCSNTGEIAAVFLHEWGHGLDQNTGGAANENGSGEAVGDTFAFLETRDHCIGENFRPGHTCHNCTTCTGVRDVGDFGVDGARTIASPANVTATGGIDCGAYVGDVSGTACPYVSSTAGAYQGVMGWEGHCESVIASSANWDLTQALVQQFGDSGWDRMDDIWYGSLTPSKSAYQIQSGGRCNTEAVVNGCAATNWYTVYLAADDDDGNLANGTPNACRIWDAFDAHGIACGERPVCSADAPDFTLTIENDEASVCAPADATYTIDVGAQLGFSDAVTLSSSGQPAGTTVTFDPNPVAPGGTTTMTVSGTGSAAAGGYTITVSGAASGSDGHSADVHLSISTGTPDAPALTAPADASTDVGVMSAFSWQAVPGAVSYTIEVATDAEFQNIVASDSGITATSWAPISGLPANTSFFWRVRAASACGDGASSTAFSFTTANQVCSAPHADIPDDDSNGVSDSMTFTDATPVSGLRLHIGATHTYVGDLRFTLTRGSSVIVINEGNCSTANIDVDLDDAAPTSLSCNSNPPAYSGEKRPAHPLSDFDGQAFGGTWTLKAVDTAGQDTGTLDEWCLQGPAAATTTYTVGGNVSGLTGSGLALSLNGGENLAIASNGAFVFPTQLPAGASYAVTIATQPAGETCSLTNGSGTIGSSNVADVAVECIDPIFADGFEGVSR